MNLPDILDNYRGLDLMMIRRDVDDMYLVGFQDEEDYDVWCCTFSLSGDLNKAIYASVNKLNKLLEDDLEWKKEKSHSFQRIQ